MQNIGCDMKDSEKNMSGLQKEALKAAREITVKFIETGRISPANFADIFPSIYNVILASISSGVCPELGKFLSADEK